MSSQRNSAFRPRPLDVHVPLPIVRDLDDLNEEGIATRAAQHGQADGHDVRLPIWPPCAPTSDLSPEPRIRDLALQLPAAKPQHPARPAALARQTLLPLPGKAAAENNSNFFQLSRAGFQATHASPRISAHDMLTFPTRSARLGRRAGPWKVKSSRVHPCSRRLGRHDVRAGLQANLQSHAHVHPRRGPSLAFPSFWPVAR